MVCLLSPMATSALGCARYNERLTWLLDVSCRLDTSVFEAYGWDPSISHEELLGRLLELNFSRSIQLGAAGQ
jgi:hypothetical protein